MLLTSIAGLIPGTHRKCKTDTFCLLTPLYDRPGSWAAATSRRELRGTTVPSVAIMTAIQPDPCAFPTADHIYALGVGNKQDYAHAHGWELHLSPRLIDPAVTAVGA